MIADNNRPQMVYNSVTNHWLRHFRAVRRPLPAKQQFIAVRHGTAINRVASVNNAISLIYIATFLSNSTPRCGME